MGEERRNELLDSPLYDFVKRGWGKWSREIVSVQVTDEDFLLYLVWALDTIKEQEDGVNVDLWTLVHSKLRARFIKSQFNSNKDDLDFMANLVCAAAMTCFGLTLTGSIDNQEIYSELVSGFGEDWAKIKQLKDTKEMNISDPNLKEWAVEYLQNDLFYTYNDEIDWNEDYMAVNIRLKEGFDKVDFFRIIMALYEMNAFVTTDGTKLTKIKVFKAFGEILGDASFKTFNNNLSSGSTNKGDITIFQDLAEGFEKYEAEKDKKLQKQGKPLRRVK